MNMLLENIGARRLHGIVEKGIIWYHYIIYLICSLIKKKKKVLEEISFNAPELKGTKQIIDSEYVRNKLEPFRKNIDLARFLIWIKKQKFFIWIISIYTLLISLLYINIFFAS